MQETPQQYIKRILGYIEGKDVMEILSSTPKQVAALVEGASKESPVAASGTGKMVGDGDPGAPG